MMAAQSNLEILENLELGKIKTEQAIRKISKIRENETSRINQLHKRFFSCVTIRVKPEGKFGLFFKIPIGLLNFALTLASLNPKLRHKLSEQGISLREVHSLIRFLKYREAGFEINVQAKDGTKIKVTN